MKIVKFDESMPETDKKVRLRLFDEGSGDSILLAVVDESGIKVPSGNVLSIDRTGQLFLFSGIDSKFGFILDGSNRLKISS